MEQETFHLTNIDNYFPELVWKFIVKKLKTPSDVENCSNSGQFFNKLLQKKRETCVVLPKVFEILAEKYAKSEDDSYTEANPDSVPWNRPAYRRISRMTGIWKCRLVCKLWSKAIDDLFQRGNVCHFYFSDIDESIPCTPASKNSHLLQYTSYPLKTHTVDGFLARFTSTHYDICAKRVTKNPFVGRNVEFEILTHGTEEYLVKYRNDICETLEKWGREIWHCRIYHFSVANEDDEVQFYQMLRESLIWMPNLKSLNVFCTVMRNDYVQPELLREIGENPFPSLPKLMFLKGYNFRGPVFDHFLSVINIPDGNIRIC